VLPTATTTTQPQSPPSSTQSVTRRLVMASTPARLSLLRAGFIVLALIFAVVGAFGVNRRANAIHEVRNASRQLLALQDIQVRVVHADAIASSSYLRSGQEDPVQRTAYLDEIAKAGDGLVAVSAAATSADLDQLSTASRLLGSYVGLVEQARANNRQGFPVGAAYQRQANGIVSNADPDTPDIVSSLRTVEESQRSQINHSLASAHRAGIWLHVTGWLLFIALVVGSWWLWRTFRRVVNLPIAIALLVLFLLLLIGGVSQARAASDTDDAVGTQLSGADAAAQARAAAFEARSQEALTLINRGNGAANEVNWQLGNDVVSRETANSLGSDVALASAYASYSDAHIEIRALDNAGDWDQAVAVSLGAQKTSNGINSVDAFDAFDQAVGKIATTEGTTASARLSDAVNPLSSLRNIVFLAGLVVAVLAALGCGQRLKEYR
jgi:hypothetical protein